MKHYRGGNYTLSAYPLDEFQQLPTKEKIRSLISIEGHAPIVKDVQPLGVIRRTDKLSDFEKGLAARERKRKYSILRGSAISTIVLLAGLFTITEFIPVLLVQIDFAVTVGVWIIFIALVTVVQWLISSKEIKKLDKEITERLILQKEQLIVGKNRLMKIFLLERDLRNIPKHQLNRWVTEIFNEFKEKALKQINVERVKAGLPETFSVNFAPLDDAENRAKENLFSFLLQHESLFVTTPIFPRDVVRKVRSARFKKEERKRLGT